MNDNKNPITGAISQVADALADLVEKVFDFGGSNGFPFSKFRDEIVERYKYGERNNLGKPTAAQIVVSVTGNADSKYKTSLALYYKAQEGIKRLVKEYEIKQIIDIPPEIEKTLQTQGNEKITFDYADLEEIITNRDLKINTDNKDISTLIYEHIDKNATATVNILDFVLYFRIRIYQQKDGNDICTNEFLTSKIIGISQEDTAKLSKNHEINLLVKP